MAILMFRKQQAAFDTYIIRLDFLQHNKNVPDDIISSLNNGEHL